MPPKTKKAELEVKFNKLAEEWEKETAFHSSSYFIVNHPAYRQIIEMGEPVLPLIFREMETNGYHWRYALYAITGATPGVAEEDRGNVEKIDEAWLKWGREQGYNW